MLARRFNFRTAAAELNLSQPTLSRHIAELERELGFKLLERNPVALTPAGKRYLEAIGDIIDQLDTAIAESRGLARQTSETLRVAMIPAASLMTDIAYAALALMRAKSPALALQVVTDKALNAFELAVRGQADVALLSCEPAAVPEGFVCTPFAECDSAVWTHRSSPLLARERVHVKDLADYHLIASTNQTFYSWFESQQASLRAHGIEPKVRLKAIDSLFDFALSIQPDEIMLSEKHNPDPSARCNPDLVRVPSVAEKISSTYYVLRRIEPSNPLAMRFEDACKKAAAQMAAAQETS